MWHSSSARRYRSRTPGLGATAVIAVIALVALATAPGLPAQEIIRPGDPALRVERIPFGTDSTRVWRYAGEQRQKGPLQIQVVERVSRAGEQLVRVTFTLESERGDLYDTTTFRLPSFQPIAHRSRPAPGARWRTLEVNYGEDVVTGSVTPPDSASRRFARALDEPVFDPGVGNLVLAMLPLRPGYEFRVPMFNHESREVHLYTYRVTGEDVVPYRGKTSVDVWTVDVELPGGHTHRMSVDKDSGRVVRGETRLGNDMRVVSLPAGS